MIKSLNDLNEEVSEFPADTEFKFSRKFFKREMLKEYRVKDDGEQRKYEITTDDRERIYITEYTHHYTLYWKYPKMIQSKLVDVKEKSLEIPNLVLYIIMKLAMGLS